ncbi:MAG: hypothetical protein QOD72_3631 [Acidimicrobiaceae bacterium]|nr:hypothetical protein [Acidimicrobiaceae bacterium]
MTSLEGQQPGGLVTPLCVPKESRSGCGNEFVDNPLGDADRVGARQPEHEVTEAGVEGLADRVAGGRGLVVGDRQIHRPGEGGGVFLITKRGLASALQSDSAAFATLHAYFLDRLVPVCAQLLDAAAAAGETVPDVDARGLMRGIGNLCIGADTDPDYDARRMVQLVIAGLRPQ